MAKTTKQRTERGEISGGRRIMPPPIPEQPVSQPAPESHRRGRRPPPPNETAEERFIRIGEPRVNRAVRAIAQLGNLANKGYKYEDEHIDAIEKILLDTLNLALGRLRRKRPGTTTFTFIE